MLSNVVIVVLIILAIIAAIWLIVRLYSRHYIKTTAGTAFVRTGGRGTQQEPLVVVNGAAWVFGFLHRIKWVSLETVTATVKKMGDDPLVTVDPQYVDFEARFFVKVGSDTVSISAAARTISGEAVDGDSIRRIVDPKLQGVVRDVAAGLELKQLMEKRRDFIAALRERLRDELAENGIVLESVSIITLRPKTQGEFSTDDVLGAQVARTNAAIIEKAMSEKNQLEKQGAVERSRQDAEAERQRMVIEEQLEKERAERIKSIAIIRANEETEAQVKQEAKREEAERAHILAERALTEERIRNERLEAVLREQADKDLRLEKLQVERDLAIAEEERQIQIAEAVIRKLAAESQRIEADLAREQVLQSATSAIDQTIARREGELELINLEYEARRKQMETEREIELETLRRTETAELETALAGLQVQIQRMRAETEYEVVRLQAQGDRERQSASGLAEVQVSLERVKVLQLEAEALRQKMIAQADGERARLETLASYDGLGQQLELAHLTSDTTQAIEIARAKALGEAIANMDAHIYGDGATAHRLLQLISWAQGAGQVYEALPDGAKTSLHSLFGGRSNGSSATVWIDQLLTAALRIKPDLHDLNPPLGVVIDLLTEYNALPDMLRSLADQVRADETLRSLPLSAALALTKIWSPE
jgi:uncharacterized membrane protein YqiK